MWKSAWRRIEAFSKSFQIISWLLTYYSFFGSKIVYRFIRFLQHFQSTRKPDAEIVFTFICIQIYTSKNHSCIVQMVWQLKESLQNLPIFRIPLTMTLKQHVALLPYSSGSEMAMFSYTDCDVQLHIWYCDCLTSYSRVFQFQSRGRKVCVRRPIFLSSFTYTTTSSPSDGQFCMNGSALIKIISVMHMWRVCGMF